MKPSLVVENVSFTYIPDGVRALTDVSCTIRHAKTTFFGPNGSGKTTLLKCMSGLLLPSTGTITVAGIQLANETRHRVGREVILVPQDPREFLISSTVEGELSFALHGVVDEVSQKKIIDTALERFSLAPLRNRVSTRLSTGEQRRVMLALAFTIRPSFLLIDEPTANLDAQAQETIFSHLELLVKEGIRVVIATNDRNTARRWNGYLYVLSHGHIVYRGSSSILDRSSLPFSSTPPQAFTK